MRKLAVYFAYIVALLFCLACANKGTPSGGEKDVTPPVLIKSTPENFSTSFTGNEIRLNFNEYVTFKDLQKQLIISPPMKNTPIITPLSGASKQIKIKIVDTLAANTTYVFNFGNSIVDYNENNPFEYYKYVLSTGSYIDSLSISGQITDALLQKPDDFVTVALYEIDSTYTDSIVFKQKPRYITNTLSETINYTLSNLKAGDYQLIALKEESQDFIYNQSTDKIAFFDTVIRLPSDSIPYNLTLFKAENDFSLTRATQVHNQKISVGYLGDYKTLSATLISPKKDIEIRATKAKEADTLYYWYKPKIDADSLLIQFKKGTYLDTLKVRLKDIPKDTLKLNAETTGTLPFNLPFKFSANLPLIRLDTTKVKIIDKDSVFISYTAALDTITNTYSLAFDKKESNAYKVIMLPGSVFDFFETTNDSLAFSISTIKRSDYGNVRVQIKNAVYPLLVQLTDEKGNVNYERHSLNPEELDFNFVKPATYKLRVIFDTNGNKKFDSGNFLKRQQPEKISYFPKDIEVRSGWDLIQEFILK